MKSERSVGFRAGGLACALAVLAVLSGCRDILTDPAPAGPALLALTVVLPDEGVGDPGAATAGPASPLDSAASSGPAATPGAAFDQADRIAIRLRGEGGTRLDLDRPFRSQGAETRVRVEVELEEVETVSLTLTLSRQGAPLFQADGSTRLEPGESSSLVLELQGIVAGVEVEAAAVELEALGDRATLSARPVFATGQTVPGTEVLWTSRDPGVAWIVAGGQVEAVAEGETEVVARVGSLEGAVTVRVRQRVAQVRPSPTSVALVVGASQTLSLTLVDRNGAGIAPSGRIVTWASSHEGVATVSSGGQVTGISEGTASITATVEGVSGQVTVTVTDPQPPEIVTGSLPGGTVGEGYSFTLEATGGELPYSCSLVSGTPPPGLALSPTGIISGTPTTAGTFAFAVRVTGGNGLSVEREFTLEVEPAPEPPTITTSSLPGATVGESYSAALAATGGQAPYSWSLASGLLPAGLTLSQAGVISGKPTTDESRTFTVRVTGADGLSSTRSLSITVSPSNEPLRFTGIFRGSTNISGEPLSGEVRVEVGFGGGIGGPGTLSLSLGGELVETREINASSSEVVSFTLRTDEFQLAFLDATPRWMNGERTLEALWIASAGGAVAIAEPVVLANPDRLLLWGAQEGITWIRDNQLWYAGDFIVELGLVSYGGQSLASASVQFCGEEAASSSPQEGRVFFEFGCGGYVSANPTVGSRPTGTGATGTSGLSINVDYLDITEFFPIRIDNLNPGQP